MKRISFIVAIAAIVAVIVLIVLRPESPFFGRDARVAVLQDKKDVRPTQASQGVELGGVDELGGAVGASERANPPKLAGDQVAHPAQHLEREIIGSKLTAEERKVAGGVLGPKLAESAVRDYGKESPYIGAAQPAIATATALPSKDANQHDLRLREESAEREMEKERADLAAAQKMAMDAEPMRSSSTDSAMADSTRSTFLSPTYIKSLPSKDGWGATNAGWGDANDDFSGDDPILIRAGNVVVRLSEFEAALKALPEGEQKYAAGDGKRKLAEDCLTAKLLTLEESGSELGYSFERASRLSVGSASFSARGELKSMAEASAVSDAEVRHAYERSKAKYEWVKVRRIFVAFDGSVEARQGSASRTEGQARTKAEAIRAELLNGADFAEEARAESDDIRSGINGGDLGRIVRGQMVSEFEKAAFSASVGEITPIVRSQYGYQIIRVDDRGIRTFDEVKVALARSLRIQKRQAVRYLNEAGVVFNEAYFGSTSNRDAPAMKTKAAAPAAKKP